MTQQRNATRAQATVTLTQLQKGLGADGITEADFTDEDEDEDEDDREKDKHRAPRVRHTSSPAANGDAAVCASVRGVARATFSGFGSRNDVLFPHAWHVAWVFVCPL